VPRKKPAVPVVTTPLPPRGLRVEQAAEYAGITVSLMRTLIGAGKVPAIRLGTRDVILKDDLDAYLDSLRRRFPKV
jgi:excisionase family DNA binding protein